MLARHCLALGALMAVAACNAEPEMPTRAEGAKLFADNCTACHGFRAEGDEELVGGQVAANLTRIAARNGGVFPRAAVLSQIDGFTEGRHAGRVMPEFGAILTGDAVPVEVDGVMTPTPRPLAALLEYLEDIQE